MTPANPLLAELGFFRLVAFQDLKIEMAASGRLRHDFSVGDPIEPTPAFIRAAFRDGVDDGNPRPSVEGNPALRATIVAWAERRFGVPLDPDRHVLATAGSRE